MIWMSLIMNKSVTTEDINLQARPFGPCNNQEKDCNNKPAPAVSNLVEIPDKFLETHEDVTI